MMGMDRGPQPGQVWKHYKGGFYKIVTLAKKEAQPGTKTVVYQALQEPFDVWERPLAEWYERVRIDDSPAQITACRFELTGYKVL